MKLLIVLARIAGTFISGAGSGMFVFLILQFSDYPTNRVLIASLVIGLIFSFAYLVNELSPTPNIFARCILRATTAIGAAAVFFGGMMAGKRMKAISEVDIQNYRDVSSTTLHNAKAHVLTAQREALNYYRSAISVDVNIAEFFSWLSAEIGIGEVLLMISVAALLGIAIDTSQTALAQFGRPARESGWAKFLKVIKDMGLHIIAAFDKMLERVFNFVERILDKFVELFESLMTLLTALIYALSEKWGSKKNVNRVNQNRQLKSSTKKKPSTTLHHVNRQPSTKKIVNVDGKKGFTKVNMSSIVNQKIYDLLVSTKLSYQEIADQVDRTKQWVCEVNKATGARR